MIALLLGGWVAACGTGLAAGGLWRVLGWRMESVARACHELRGPLTAARLGLELGTRTGELSPERLRAIDLELGRAALALEELDTARDRRTITRRESGPVDLVELVYDSAEALRPWAVSRGVELRIVWRGAQPAVVVGERLRLAQAIGNLIANAIEHGGGAVEVCGASVGDAVKIEVLDAGPGLPKSVAELTAHGRDERGRGLGLAIAADIVAGHGGRLSAAPSVGGARLMVELPAPPGLQGQLRAS
jgi:signal transduction histidine kinase